MHGCLGRPLARLEARIALEEALPVLGDYELAGPPGFYPSSPNMYVWKHPPVTFGRSGSHRPHVEAVHHRTTTVTLATSEFEAEARVTAKREAADGVITLALRAVDEHPLPPWEAGAHVDLVLGDAPTRQYSLCGDPADHHEYRLGILRDSDGRGSSLHVHDRLAVGDTVRLRGPRNNFPLVDSPRYLFIAGGIGITPILAMIRTAEGPAPSGGSCTAVAAGPPWPSSTNWRATASGSRSTRRTRPACSTWTPARHPEPDTLVYCGSEALLAAVEQRVTAWPQGSLRVERFAPKPQAEPVRAEAFEVVLQQSELTLTVPPERSVLSVVEEAGVGAVLLRGGHLRYLRNPGPGRRTDHRDSVLDEDESQAERRHDDLRLPCVHERLVLDL